MKNWKISKLRIQGFKAFSFVDFDFEGCSLLTLEGPNGYGKTTVFDAIELLFTGSISRIEKLFKAVMLKGQKNYRDNLYWNTKGGQEILSIKAELIDEGGGRLAFARVAQVEDLLNQANNRADRFDIFTLYALDDFESEVYGEPLPTEHLDEHFGSNFCKNYSMLNYLQQGQSTFIFGNTIAERKEALEGLLDSATTRHQIEVCTKAERRLSLLNSDGEKQKIRELASQVDDLSKSESDDEPGGEYDRLSTLQPAPTWDSEVLFVQLDVEKFGRVVSEVGTLLEMSRNKEEIRIRKRNREIEQYVVEKDQLISLAVVIGKDVERYENLKIENARLNDLSKALSSIKKGGKSLSSADLLIVAQAGIAPDPRLSDLISSRDSISKQLDGKSVEIVDLQKLRADLVARHRHAFGDDASSCPLCGADWEFLERLAGAIDETTKFFDKELGQLAGQLADAIRQIDEIVTPMQEVLAAQKNASEGRVEKALFDELGKNQQSFDALLKFNERLAAQKIEYVSGFTIDPVERTARKERLVASIRALKTNEGEPPPAGWEAALSYSFKTVSDFLEIDPARFEKKIRYIKLQHREKQNIALQNAKLELARRQNSQRAMILAKEKISALKALLVKVERDYSARTISDIELIFHIYSGRLIQNYQRGLGLFIDRGNGTKLQFCTAEQSEHDATLSMSSGQISALSLAFFLSLNRVYSKNPFVLIDDPAQSLDEINIASLTDLLRCELRDRQLIMSSHEDDIAAYMRYRFYRAGLTQKPFHMQTYLEKFAPALPVQPQAPNS